MPPWWMIVLLSLFGAASQKRHASPIPTAQEYEIMRALDAYRKRQATTQQIVVLNQRIQALLAAVKTRRAALVKRYEALIARVERGERSGEVLIELKYVEEQFAILEEELARLTAYLDTFDMLRRRRREEDHAHPPSNP